MDALNKLRAVCVAASTAPWSVDDNNIRSTGNEQHNIVASINQWRENWKGNAAFIAAARSAMPALIELVEALEWERECREFYSENHYTYMPANYELLATMTAATAAVEAAKAKLDEVLK